MIWEWWVAAAGVVGLFILFIIVSAVDRRSPKKGVQIENIRAQLMLLSTDAKEIEDFLMLKEPYITQELISQLIARVAELKTEKVELTETKDGEL